MTTTNVGTAFKAPRDESDLSSSQSSAASAATDLSQTAESPTTGASAAAASASVSTRKLTIPMDFKQCNALDLMSTEVPAHIADRWRMMDKDCNVNALFGTVAKSNKSLSGIALQMLQPLTGETEYGKVHARTKCNQAPNLGLSEIFSLNKIAGYSQRAKSKGLMFFYLMCTYPGQVQYPEFESTAEKRKRASAFTLAEAGRLVAIIADPQNRPLVSMLFKKWSRADLDARAGKKGQAYYWCKLGELYNRKEYVPEDNETFADHVRSCETAAIYGTRFVPEHRTADNLKTQWGVLRANYALFYSKYDKSGMNNPDPTAYTSDLPTLLMHWTFHDTDMVSWAAKSLTQGAMDDAGDGAAAASTTSAVAKKKKKNQLCHLKRSLPVPAASRRCTMCRTTA